jgi:colicin import membrane protein
MNAAALLGERPDPGAFASAMLSAAMHLILLALLVFGVQWQNRPPEAVEVELWLPPPPPPAPVVEAPKPEPAPKVEPAPPPKPEPVLPKPEIVQEKAPPPKPKPVPKVEPKPVPPKPVAKVEPKPPPPKPVAKAEPLRPRVDETKRMQEELAREQASLAIDRERQMLKDLGPGSPPSNSKAQAAWVDKVRAKIRGNIILPPEIKGNPEALVEVVQLPTGEVLSVKLKRSSGMAALDNAIERAVLKSSPLPKPDSGFPMPREFEFKYKPHE